MGSPTQKGFYWVPLDRGLPAPPVRAFRGHATALMNDAVEPFCHKRNLVMIHTAAATFTGEKTKDDSSKEMTSLSYLFNDFFCSFVQIFGQTFHEI